jgi:hypothetical protein
VEGECGLLLDEKSVAFTQGSSLHFCIEEARFTLRGLPGKRARILVFLDPKEAIST